MLKFKMNLSLKKQYDQAREKWLKEKADSNKKAQQELEKHVK